MPRKCPGRKDLQAYRERRESARDTALGHILEDARPPMSHAFVEWTREPTDYWPGVNADTAPVTIYAPDGTFRERVSADEFRRRYPPRLRTVRR